jgi:hypothetical protein
MALQIVWKARTEACVTSPYNIEVEGYCIIQTLETYTKNNHKYCVLLFRSTLKNKSLENVHKKGRIILILQDVLL